MEKDEVQKVDALVKEKHTWFERMLNHQSQKKLYEPPAVTAAAINSERTALESLSHSVFSKPKPAPPPPPPQPPADTAAPAAGAAGAQQPASGAGEQQPGAAPKTDGAQKPATPGQGSPPQAQKTATNNVKPSKPGEPMDVD